MDKGPASVHLGPFFLLGLAELWYLENQLAFHRAAERLWGRCLERFSVNANHKASEESPLTRKQNRQESIDAYDYDILSRCHKLGKKYRDTVSAFIRRLLPEIKGQVAVV